MNRDRAELAMTGFDDKTVDRRRPGLGAWLLAVCVALVVATAFQGSRGLWEPDEGRYADAALSMLESGDWWIPHLHDEVYLDKPPLHYWSIALGLRLFGFNEWGARAGHATLFFATCCLIGLLAHRWWGGWAGPTALAAYAATLLPAAAANAITPDTPLTFFVVATTFAYWQTLTSESKAARWLWSLVLACALGMGILTKGPAMVLFIAPLIPHAWLQLGTRALIRRIDLWLGLGLGLAVGASWYLSVAGALPGAASYMFDNQVTGRLVGDHYLRNSGWWAPLEIYLPALTLGLLPASLAWPGWIAASWRRRSLRGLMDGLTDGRALLLVLWLGLPLMILGIASSRLTLYVLPLAAPLVLATASRWTEFSWPRSRVLVYMAFGLVILKGVAADVIRHEDTRALADVLRDAGVSRETRIVTAEKRHGLPFYGYDNFLWTTRDAGYPYYSTPPELGPVLRSEAAACHPRGLVLVSRKGQEASNPIEGLTCVPIPSHHERVAVESCHCRDVKLAGSMTPESPNTGAQTIGGSP